MDVLFIKWKILVKNHAWKVDLVVILFDYPASIMPIVIENLEFKSTFHCMTSRAPSYNVRIQGY